MNNFVPNSKRPKMKRSVNATEQTPQKRLSRKMVGGSGDGLVARADDVHQRFLGSAHGRIQCFNVGDREDDAVIEVKISDGCEFHCRYSVTGRKAIWRAIAIPDYATGVALAAEIMKVCEAHLAEREAAEK